jgi:hypothetical protein
MTVAVRVKLLRHAVEVHSGAEVLLLHEVTKDEVEVRYLHTALEAAVIRLKYRRSHDASNGLGVVELQ